MQAREIQAACPPLVQVPCSAHTANVGWRGQLAALAAVGTARQECPSVGPGSG